MANKVAIISPARNEKYLPQTVESCLSNASGEVEFIAVLEGYTPDGWTGLQAKWPNLHTIYNPQPVGMRGAINRGAASAISRGAKYLMKLDAHCMVAEGFDEVLKADCDDDWVVVPRRKRLAPETWTLQDVGKPDIDYHYLSFPDNVNDFGGPGLNGRVWAERAKQRIDIELDDEMSSQGSGWFMHSKYFQQLELMDEASYGTFWNEFQEIGMKCWLSGGQVKVNKRTWYAHWHKGSAGRGYMLDHKLLRQGRNHTMRWLYNEAWAKQTRPIKWLIDHFWPVPTWPEGWESLVYAGPNKSKIALTSQAKEVIDGGELETAETPSTLRVVSAFYGPSGTEIDVSDVLRAKIANDSLDLNVTNGELGVGNPFRGVQKKLTVTYSYDNQPPTTLTKDEREWLIVGQSARWVKQSFQAPEVQVTPIESVGIVADHQTGQVKPLLTPQALNDYLIRKFSIPSHRLRGPMPIELRDFHRDDLAKLFAELQFNRGAEIGVAEGKYSEVLIKANPNLQLLCVDPWGAYDGNRQQKSSAKHEFAISELKRRVGDQAHRVSIIRKLSMDAVREVEDGSLDWVYIDANHSYDYFMEDLINWSRKVRSGGIIAGDDAYKLDPKRWGAGPMEGIYDYTCAHQIEPWFLINAHKSVDFFFIKQ